MRTLALALLIAATPAAAQSVGDSVYQVSFKGVTFTCGAVDYNGTTQRLLRATQKLNLPVYEPAANHPQAASWAILYRIICERSAMRQAKAGGMRQADNEGNAKHF